MADIQSPTAENKREKEGEEEEKNYRTKIKWPVLFHRAAIINQY